MDLFPFRSKLVRLFYPIQTSTDSRAKLDWIEEVLCVRKAYPLQFGSRRKRIHSRVHGALESMPKCCSQVTQLIDFSSPIIFFSTPTRGQIMTSLLIKPSFTKSKPSDFSTYFSCHHQYWLLPHFVVVFGSAFSACHVYIPK